MKCKYCGREFKFAPNKKFCCKSCADSFRYRKSRKKSHKCIVCGKEFDFKNAQKYCSKECAKEAKNAKWRNDYAKAKAQKELRKASYHLYDKQFNPNIDRCLNCIKDDCDGECEYINTLIQG